MALDKLVIGKPAGPRDAINGFMDAGTLASCLGQAYNSGWSACIYAKPLCHVANFIAGGGAMVWQYPHAGSDWIRTVRSQSRPM